MLKQVKAIVPNRFKRNTIGFSSVDNFNYKQPIEPFLVFTEFHMSHAIFGPHPHAGVSVMTYMLPQSTGAFINRDSLGDYSLIEAGGIHVTQAGSGIQHDEVPEIDGTDCHGFQIWINHADKDRLVAPKAFHASSKEVPEYVNEQMKVRVIQGSFQDLKAPFDLLTPVIVLDVTLQAKASILLDSKEMGFVYVISGSGQVGKAQLKSSDLVLFGEEGNQVKVEATDQEIQFIFASGTPHHEPIVYGGPYVMTTQEQLSETKKRYARGEMGVLNHLTT
jgi:redox-sensitive bicupin YhaK (pirin superfamily)